MSKIELDPVASGFNLEVINTNFQRIEDELNGKVLYRNNPAGQANQMSGNLDMNGFAILNAPNIGGGGGGASDAASVSFTPTGSISSTNVQAAIVEVAAEGAQPAINFPLANAVAAQIGSSARYAREDHVHPGTGGGGGEGTPGTSAAVVYAYKRAVSAPVDNPGAVTYNFVVAQIVSPSGDALANGWTKTIPSGSNPLYTVAASASSTAPTDSIAANEWSSPVLLVSNGVDGNNGLNVATVYLYQRNNTGTAPPLPNANITYQFNPVLVTGITNGWSTTVPAASGGKYLYVTTATAVSATATDVIGSSEWATVQIMAQDGAQGPAGPTGSNGVPGQRGTLTVYQSGQTSWSDSVATSAIQAVGLGGPYDRDVVTEYGTNFSQTRFYSSGSWIILTAIIDGSLLVTGTVSASKVNGGTLSGVQIKIGSGGTPSGGAFEVTNSGVCWSDTYRGGTVSVSNAAASTVPAVTGSCDGFSGSFGLMGQVNAANSNGNAGGVRGVNFYRGTSGTIAPNGTYDFYADGSGTNFGPFTGAHDALVPVTESADIGDILVDVECLSHGQGVSNTIFAVTKSSVPNQAAAIGVMAVPMGVLDINSPPAGFTIGWGVNWQPVIDPIYPTLVTQYMRTAVNALGEGVLNVVGEGGEIKAGDLIVTSSVAGKGMRSDSDFVTKYTVAKAREGCEFVGNEVKQIACIYLCG